MLFRSAIASLENNEYEIPTPFPKFAHGAEFLAVKGRKQIKVVASYHPSQQNTFTGKLTEKMLSDVIVKAFKAPK